MNMTGKQIAAVLCCSGIIIGSFLPWAEVGGFFSRAGTDGDGVLTLILGGIALALVLIGKTPIKLYAAGGLIALAAAIGIYDAIDISRIGGADDSFGIEVTVGSGLYLVIISSIAGLVATGARALEVRSAAVQEA